MDRRTTGERVAGVVEYGPIVGDRAAELLDTLFTQYVEDLCLDAAEAIEQRLGCLTPIDPVVAAVPA